MSNASDFRPLTRLKHQVITANTTAVPGNLYFCNTAGGAFTLTLPASPADRTRVGLSVDSTAETNPLTINTNGASFDGSTSDIVVGVPVEMELVYFDSAWRLAP